jgi:hypothetical protein
VVARPGDERRAACEHHQLWHPHAADHYWVDPLDGEHRRPCGEHRGPSLDLGDTLLEILDDMTANVHPADGPRDPQDVVPNVVEPLGVQVDDAYVVHREPGDSGLHVIQGNGAHIAEVLRDDHVGPRFPELLHVDLVDRQHVLEHVADGLVDRPAAGKRADPGGSQHGDVLDAGRVVALVRATDEIVLRAQGADDLGGTREEGDDAHSISSVLHFGSVQVTVNEPACLPIRHLVVLVPSDMSSTLVVVDGHNVFNDIGRFFEGADRTNLQAYVRNWFDVDRLVNASLSQNVRLDPWRDLGIVVFHSRKRLGEQNDPYSITGEAALEFWARQGAATNTAAMLVDVPGAPSGKDVGMDISIVVYLFETAERWEAAVLFTNDADFAPAVWSLRRRGKRVYCSSPARNLALPLVQSCQSFLPWDVQFLRADRALFTFLSPAGPLDRFLEHRIVKDARPPKIVCSGGGLQLTPGYGGGGDNILNEVLRSSELHELYAQGGNDNIIVQAHDPARPRNPIGQGMLVFEGLRRHLEIFKDAAWRKHFEG